MGQCVGLRNYRYFYAFCVTVSCYCAHTAGWAGAALLAAAADAADAADGGARARAHAAGGDSALARPPSSAAELLAPGRDGSGGPVALAVAMLAAIVLCCVAPLACYHTGLVCANRTTNEEIKVRVRAQRERESGRDAPESPGGGTERALTSRAPLPTLAGRGRARAARVPRRAVTAPSPRRHRAVTAPAGPLRGQQPVLARERRRQLPRAALRAAAAVARACERARRRWRGWGVWARRGRRHRAATLGSLICTCYVPLAHWQLFEQTCDVA
jgi:hypothetical protein